MEQVNSSEVTFTKLNIKLEADMSPSRVKSEIDDWEMMSQQRGVYGSNGTLPSEFIKQERVEEEESCDSDKLETPGLISVQNREGNDGRSVKVEPERGSDEQMPSFERKGLGMIEFVGVNDIKQENTGTGYEIEQDISGPIKTNDDTYKFDNFEGALNSLKNDKKHIKSPIYDHQSTSNSSGGQNKSPHPAKTRYKCTHCYKTYAKQNVLDRHMIVHTREKPFKCEHCGKMFGFKGNLKKHILVHIGERSFKCTQCEKTFLRSTHLASHMLTHIGERPFKCDRCEKSFLRSNALTRHMLTHTGERPFQCDQCDKAFSQSTHLTRHMVIHSGEKPFKCKYCDKAFHFVSNLEGHMRSHSGKKPYKCELCDKRFGWSSCLKNHMYQHSGEKRFKCKLCDSAFTSSSSLRNHVKLHSRERPLNS